MLRCCREAERKNELHAAWPHFLHPFLFLDRISYSLSIFFFSLLPLSSPRFNPAASSMQVRYNAIGTRSPYGSGDPYYNTSTGYMAPISSKRPQSRWTKFGVPAGILVAIGLVVAIVVASTHHNHSRSGGGSGSSGGSPAAASSAVSAKNAVGIFPTATDSEFMKPLYPSTVRLS